MRLIVLTLTALAFTLFLWPPEEAAAHSGGLNSQGCHAGSKPYHCHRSSSEMVGNRLRCDLGSRSKECENRKPKPSNPKESEENATNSSLSATQVSDAIRVRPSVMPNEYQGGIGLHCSSTHGSYFLLLSSDKTRIGRAWFKDDKLKYHGADVNIWAKELTLGTGWRLNRQNLQLFVGTSGEKRYSCDIYSPAETHDMAQQSLQLQLNKNKL